MARYALRNQDKIAERLGSKMAETLLATIRGGGEPAGGEDANGYKTLVFADLTDKSLKHHFAVTGGLYDVKILAYIKTERTN